MNERLLSAFLDYLRGHASLDGLYRLLAEVDWDDTSIPSEVRGFLLEAELIIAGIDEGFGDEQELRELLQQSPLLSAKTL